MFVVDNKFDVGEECYSVYRGFVSSKCPICEGAKKIVYKGYEIPCSKCNWNGEVAIKELGVCKVVIRRIKVTRFIRENGEEANDIRYVVKPIEPNIINGKKREETKLFKTYEEAKEFCEKANAGEAKLQAEI